MWILKFEKLRDRIIFLCFVEIFKIMNPFLNFKLCETYKFYIYSELV